MNARLQINWDELYGELFAHTQRLSMAIRDLEARQANCDGEFVALESEEDLCRKVRRALVAGIEAIRDKFGLPDSAPDNSPRI